MKKHWIVIAAVVAVIIIAFRIDKSQPYDFPNRDETVVSIEMIHNPDVNKDGHFGIDPENFRIIRVLGEEEVSGFMKKLYGLKTERSGPPPSYGYGEYILRVTYANGNVELFTPNNIVHIEEGETSSGVGSHYFKDYGLEALFYEYLDGSYVPE